MFIYNFIYNGYNIAKYERVGLILVILFIFLYPYSLWWLLKKMNIEKRFPIWAFIILIHITLINFQAGSVLRKELRKRNIIIFATVYKKHSNINSPGRIYYEFYGEDGKLYSGKEICPEGSYRSFEIGDTVLVRYAVSDPYLNKVYNFWPTSDEIKEYRNGKKYKYVNGQYVEVKGDE